jgi:hypothetical protein
LHRGSLSDWTTKSAEELWGENHFWMIFWDLDNVGEQSVIQKVGAEEVSGFEFEFEFERDDQKMRRSREKIDNLHRLNSKRDCSSVVSRSRSQTLNDSGIIQSKKDAQKWHRQEKIIESNMEWQDSLTSHFLVRWRTKWMVNISEQRNEIEERIYSRRFNR